MSLRANSKSIPIGTCVCVYIYIHTMAGRAICNAHTCQYVIRVRSQAILLSYMQHVSVCLRERIQKSTFRFVHNMTRHAICKSHTRNTSLPVVVECVEDLCVFVYLYVFKFPVRAPRLAHLQRAVHQAPLRRLWDQRSVVRFSARARIAYDHQQCVYELQIA